MNSIHASQKTEGRDEEIRLSQSEALVYVSQDILGQLVDLQECIQPTLGLITKLH